MFYDGDARTLKCDPIQSWHLLMPQLTGLQRLHLPLRLFVLRRRSHAVEPIKNEKSPRANSVFRKGEFDWRTLVGDEKLLNKSFDETALTKMLGEVEDTEDAYAAAPLGK